MAIQDLKVSMAYSGRDIASLSDRPNQDGMSASALKARFDQLNKEVIPNYNDLIDLLDVYIQTNDSDIVALESAIEGLGISLSNLGLSVQDVLDAYNSGLLSGVYIGDTEPTDERIMVWIDPDSETIAIDEANRVAQENVRQANETIRISSENTRISNENTRISNENTRISQESSRVSAENTRVSQENARNVFATYNGSTAYVVGNKVAYNGSSYVCILNSTGNLPTNSTYWLLIASKGDKGVPGEVTTAQLNAALLLKADKTQEAWITPTLLNGWVVFGTDYYPPQYIKDTLGIVHLHGMLKSGTSGSIMFTLPSGYKPIKKLIFPSSSNYNYGNIAIDTVGNVSNVGGSINWFSLEGITFKAEQ